MYQQHVADSELTATAYHEAGHAVVAEHVGVNVGLVSVVPDGQRLGFMRQALPVPPVMTPKETRAYISVVLAGGLAEAIHRYGPELASLEHVPRTSTDFRRARAAVARSASNGVQFDLLLEDIATDVLQLLRERWNDVQLIAEALLAGGTLDGCTLRRWL
jgi:hypothetical protein